MKSDLEGDKTGKPSAPGKGGHLGTKPVLYKKIIDRRQELGWSQRTLAKKAFCSVTTLKSVEEGNEAFPSTVEKIAKPLGLLLVDLIEKAETVADLKAEVNAKPKAKVKVFFNTNYADFDETTVRGMIEEFRQKYGAEGEITVIVIEADSVLVMLEMDEEDAAALMEMLAAKGLPNLPPVYAMGIRSEGDGLSASTIERLAALSDNTLYRHRSIDLGGYKTISNKIIIGNVLISLFKRLSVRLFGFRITAFLLNAYVYYSYFQVPTILRNLNVVTSLFTPVFMSYYYERRVDLQMATRDGSVPFDWELTLLLCGVFIPNLLNFLLIPKTKDALMRNIMIVGSIINMIFFVMFYFF